MRIFIIGATAFIGSTLVRNLPQADHQVLGLARSEEGARSLRAAGAEVYCGDLEGLESLRRGAATADGVIHAGFNHDFSWFARNCEADRRVIEVLGDVLAGSARPLIVTSGLHPMPGSLKTEDDGAPAVQVGTPRVSEQTALRPRRELQASIIWPSSTPRGPNWPMPCAG